MNARRRAWLLFALLASSCASQAVRPPSPARDLSVESLLAAGKPEYEHYYILIFGSQLRLPFPRYTHTWATVVKTIELPDCPRQITEVHTISWMPATLDIHPYRCRVEAGANLDLCTTIREVLQRGERISL